MAVLKNRHFWSILVLIVLLSFLQYPKQSGLFNVSLEDSNFWLVLISLGRILFLGPILYATLVFGLKGGLPVTLAAFAVSLPSAILNSISPIDAVLEATGVLSMGLFFNLWFWTQSREKKKSMTALAELDAAHRKLQHNVEALTRSEKRFAVLNVVWSTLFGSLELKTLYERATRITAELMSSDIALLFIESEGGNELKLVAHFGISDTLAASLEKITLREGIYGEAARRGQPLISKQAAQEQIRSQLMAPLTLKGHTNGLIVVATRQVEEYTADSIELLTAIGTQISVAMENSRLYETQKATSQRLAISEGNYRRLLEHASDAIWAHDMDGRVIAANRPAGALAGFKTAEEMIGRDVRESLAWDGLTVARRVRRNLLENIPFEQPYEQRLVRTDGTEIILMISTSLIKYDEKNPVFEHVARDVTRERHMQDNLRYYVQQITRTQEEERKRIARDLHDETAQALYALTRQVDNFIRNSSGVLTPETTTFLTDLEEQIRNTLQGVRRFSQNLRPPMLDDFGLMASLRWLVRDMQQRGSIETSLSVKGEEKRLAADVELAVFRVVQEALTNVEKHAQASKLEMTISFTAESLDILIKDNGKGFELSGELSDLPRGGRLGLVGMDERVRLIGGKLDIESGTDKGTTVSIHVPA